MSHLTFNLCLKYRYCVSCYLGFLFIQILSTIYYKLNSCNENYLDSEASRIPTSTDETGNSSAAHIEIISLFNK